MSEYEQIMKSMQDLLPRPTKENYMRTYRLLCGSSFYNPLAHDVEELDTLLNARDFCGVVQKYKAANPNILLSPTAHMIYAFALKELKDTKAAEMYTQVTGSVCRGIRATGDGTKAHPFIVTQRDCCTGFVDMFLEKDVVSLHGDAETALQIVTCQDGSTVWFDFFIGLNLKTEYLKRTQPAKAEPADSGSTVEIQEPERSAAGNPILRHSEPARSAPAAAIVSNDLKAIETHVQQHIGAVAGVFHEMISDQIHIDLIIVAPTPERSCYTVVSCGMSALPMNTPAGSSNRFAELMLCLPHDWPMSPDAWKADESSYWPLRWMKMLVAAVHRYQTWYEPGHTIPSADPPEPFSQKTKLCGWLIHKPQLAPDGFARLKTPQKTISFFAMIPIYNEEMNFKLSKGYSALLQRMDEIGVDELIEVNRPCVCK